MLGSMILLLFEGIGSSACLILIFGILVLFSLLVEPILGFKSVVWVDKIDSRPLLLSIFIQNIFGCI